VFSKVYKYPGLRFTGVTTFYKVITFDDLVKSLQNDVFVKSSPAAGGTRRAKTEE
jgi:hypothetical protein